MTRASHQYAAEGRTWHYRDRNGLIRRVRYTTEGGSETHDFRYDARMQRVAVQDDTSTTYFKYDGLNRLGEWNGSLALQKCHTHGYTPIDGIGSIVDAKLVSVGELYQFYHYDHRGSLFEGEEGTAFTHQAELNAFGEELQFITVTGYAPSFGYQGTAWSRIFFGGKLYNLSPTRIYLPETGRFTQEDLAGGAGGVNLWSAFLGPNTVDPTGAWLNLLVFGPKLMSFRGYRKGRVLPPGMSKETSSYLDWARAKEKEWGFRIIGVCLPKELWGGAVLKTVGDVGITQIIPFGYEWRIATRELPTEYVDAAGNKCGCWECWLASTVFDVQIFSATFRLGRKFLVHEQHHVDILKAGAEALYANVEYHLRSVDFHAKTEDACKAALEDWGKSVMAEVERRVDAIRQISHDYDTFGKRTTSVSKAKTQVNKARASGKKPMTTKPPPKCT